MNELISFSNSMQMKVLTSLSCSCNRRSKTEEEHSK